MPKSVLKTTVQDFETNRKNMINTFNEEIKQFSKYEEDYKLADKISEDVVESDFLYKMGKLDSVTFIQVDICNKNNSNQLFGEISKAISDAIDSEINEISNINDKNASVHATPNELRDNYTIKKRRIIDETLLNVDSENFEQNLMTLRCMDIYCEMAQTTDAISERTRKKMKEHEQILLFIGFTPKMSENVSETQLSDVISYTIAVVSNIKDGTSPNIEKYKNKVVELINSSTNAVVESENIVATIKSYDDVSSTLHLCKEEIADNPNGKNFVNAISAIESICQTQKERISELYKDTENISQNQREQTNEQHKDSSGLEM